MEKYGLTARHIRIDKGLLMKEVYGGIVGRTFAYRFERGEVNLALEAFCHSQKDLSYKPYVLHHATHQPSGLIR